MPGTTSGDPQVVVIRACWSIRTDTRQAVQELDSQGIHCHAISLDPQADRYAREIFGHHFTVVDRVEHLPERLPRLFKSLTH